LPDIKGNAKSIYKELFEPNTFDVLSSIITLQDKNAQQTVTTLPIQLSEKWFESKDKTKEGFGSLKGEGTYMECVALDEDTNDEIADYAVVPLKQSGTAKAYSTVVYGLGSVLILIMFIAVHYFSRIREPTKDIATNWEMWIIFGCLLLGFILAMIGGLIKKSNPASTPLVFIGVIISIFGMADGVLEISNSKYFVPS
jgi:hypothetical protein